MYQMVYNSITNTKMKEAIEAPFWVKPVNMLFVIFALVV